MTLAHGRPSLLWTHSGRVNLLVLPITATLAALAVALAVDRRELFVAAHAAAGDASCDDDGNGVGQENERVQCDAGAGVSPSGSGKPRGKTSPATKPFAAVKSPAPKRRRREDQLDKLVAVTSEAFSARRRKASAQTGAFPVSVSPARLPLCVSVSPQL